MTPDALQQAYIETLLARVRFIYEHAPSLSDPLITTAYWDELQDLEERIEGFLFGAWELELTSPPNKRRNGAGSIYQRSDQRWVASIMRAGRRISRYLPSEDAAREALTDLIEHGETLEVSALEVSPPPSDAAPATPPHEGSPETGVGASDASGVRRASAISSPAPSPDTGVLPEGEGVPPEKEGVPPEEITPERAPSDSEIAPSISEMPDTRKRCPDCGKPISPTATRCGPCAQARRRGREGGNTRTKADGLQSSGSTTFNPRSVTAPEPAAELPECACPPAWWSNGTARLFNLRTPSDKHSHLCPLHRHRHVLPSAPDADGNYQGRCACGHVETRNPYKSEDEARARVSSHRAKGEVQA